MSIERVSILGAEVSKVTLDLALEQIEDWIAHFDGRSRFIVATGFHGIWVGFNDPEFRAIINSSDLFCPDGIAPVWLSRLFGTPLPERVPGPDLMRAFVSGAARKSFFYGDTDETLKALSQRLSEESPGHEIVGSYSPPFRSLTADEDDGVVKQINDARPDVLWVGLGLPKQEYWIHAHLGRLHVPVVAAVGAAFRLVSGQVSRAPCWLRDAGMEWAWRLACEPRKLWRRDLVDGPRFLYHALWEAYRIRSSRRAIATRVTKPDDATSHQLAS